MSAERYHPLLVILHWVTALMLVVALGMGTFVLEATPNDAPEKIDVLKGHMSGGILLLILMIVRLFVRVSTAKPPRSTTGNPMLDKLSIGVHHGFYFFIIAMAATGIATSAAAGLPDIIFGGSGAPLPDDFHDFTARILHGIIAKILMIMIVLHIAGALYHQFKLGDRLIARMKIGK